MDTTRLAELIDCKLQILQILAKLATEQLTLIEASDLTNLLKLLAAKQSVMDQLQKVERELDPFRDEDPQTRRWQSDTARTRCQQNVDRCNDLLAEVMRLEKEGEGNMVRRRDHAATRLQGVHHATEARQAYAGSELPGATGLDLSSEG